VTRSAGGAGRAVRRLTRPRGARSLAAEKTNKRSLFMELHGHADKGGICGVDHCGPLFGRGCRGEPRREDCSCVPE
jgi:hypothetical protein